LNNRFVETLRHIKEEFILRFLTASEVADLPLDGELFQQG